MLWVAGVLVRGAEAIWTFLFRRRRSRPPVDPAEELRRKLAEARERESEPESEPPRQVPEPIVAQAPGEPETTSESEKPNDADLESLRRGVHERARALSEEMRGPNDGD